MLLKASELPKWMHSSTGSGDSNRAMLETALDEPLRVTTRPAKGTPRWEKTNTDSGEPKHAMLLKSKELFSWMQPSPEDDGPN